MPDESLVREKARAVIRAGIFDRTWGSLMLWALGLIALTAAAWFLEG